VLLRESIYGAIRRAILTCEFEPGQELREQVLAERYHVSRSPVRDALLRLELESLVTVLPRQGYLVNAISIPDVAAMFDLRLLVSSACAARAAHADETTVQTLEPFRSDPGGETDEDTFVESNRAFHCGIADICGNPRLAALEYDLVQQFSRLIRVSLRHAQNSSVPDAISEHNAMISAIQSHDAEAASRLAYKHVESGQSRIMAALRRSAEAGEKISRTRICDRDRAQ
jgi:GntR family transcriptional regulator, rspAB operon transcriptional repressor